MKLINQQILLEFIFISIAKKKKKTDKKTESFEINRKGNRE
jgi:hypothetical protein